MKDKVLLINDVGDYHFLELDSFTELIKKNLNVEADEFCDLKSKFMVCADSLSSTIDLLATRYRTKKHFLYDFTSLHMFVITQRCNQKCTYCHASSIDENSGRHFDMDRATARKCVDMSFSSPSPHIKIEFQGGEPLLNFDVVKEIVDYAHELNKSNGKRLDFVICTNITKLDSTQIEFIRENDICISTSLDGPSYIHDICRRTRQGYGTYEIVSQNIAWAQECIGRDKVSALMTVTPFSIHQLREVIDEYLARNLSSIFIRMINPYGSALKFWSDLGYGIEQFMASYADALEYIIILNKDGVFFQEDFATLLLTRILTPFSTGFVDLQSPSGAGIGGVIYETNGDVFIADEGRMLAKTNGDRTFCIGNVHSDNWTSIFCGKKLKQIIASSCIESIPGCAWCVYQPYCGSDPIRNYLQFGNFTGYTIKSDFCHKHKAIFKILFDLLENDDETNNVFWSWVTQRKLSEVKI